MKTMHWFSVKHSLVLIFPSKTVVPTNVSQTWAM